MPGPAVPALPKAGKPVASVASRFFLPPMSAPGRMISDPLRFSRRWTPGAATKSGNSCLADGGASRPVPTLLKSLPRPPRSFNPAPISRSSAPCRSARRSKPASPGSKARNAGPSATMTHAKPCQTPHKTPAIREIIDAAAPAEAKTAEITTTTGTTMVAEKNGGASKAAAAATMPGPGISIPKVPARPANIPLPSLLGGKKY